MAPVVPDFVQMAVLESACSSVLLPSGPGTISFNKDEFASSNFSVDEFIAKHRRMSIPLETLKEDLGLYLDVLETAMYDLINKDYQDFVSLSSNLVGLDHAIEDLTNPLTSLKSDVSLVQRNMKDTLRVLNVTILERNTLREKRQLLERFLDVENGIRTLQSLLGATNFQRDSSTSAGDVVEQAAHEWVKLQLLLKSKNGTELLPFFKERRATIDVITETLMKRAGLMFEDGMNQKEKIFLRQALRIYVITDRIGDVEDLFRKKRVAPYLKAIFEEGLKKNLKTTSEVLSSLYTKILEFVPSCLAPVKEVIAAGLPFENGDVSEGNDGVLRGFDFMAGAIWPEVAHQLTTQVRNLFSPGHPDMFHANYSVTISFLTRLEGLCTSQASVKRLRSDKTHVEFLSKWSLPVYFQIRFQEIGGTFEAALQDGWAHAEDDHGQDTKTHLKATSVLLACMNVCWINSVYLEPLLHRFWKLTLQLLARYRTWIEELQTEFDLPGQGAEKKDKIPSFEKTVSSVGSSGDVTMESSATTSATPEASMPTVPSSPADLAPSEKLTRIVHLMSDVDVIALAVLPLFQAHIWPRILATGNSDANVLLQCLNQSCDHMKERLVPFVDHIIGVVIQQSSVAVKQVTDVPRKYRKTNRDVPSKPSPYVTAMLEPLNIFISKNLKDQSIRQKIITQVLSQITQVYLRLTTDVLTSVQKMEESLKRLKKARGATATAADTVSDDDKIRLQFALDVKTYYIQMDKLFGFDANSLEHFVALKALVVDATANLYQ